MPKSRRSSYKVRQFKRELVREIGAWFPPVVVFLFVSALGVLALYA